MNPSQALTMDIAGLTQALGELMRITTVATAICLGLTGIAVATDAEAAIRKPTNIPSQSLAESLEDLARDRGFQILYISEVVAGIHAEAVAGALTRDEVLKHLLDKTPLTFRYLDEKTVTIVPRTESGALPEQRLPVAPPATAPAPAPSNTEESSPKTSWLQRFHLAAAEATATDVRDAQTVNSTPSPLKADDLSEVVVVGSRLSTTVKEQAQPVKVLDRAAIERSGMSSIAQALNTLPEVSINATTSPYQVGRGSNSVQLRGLPSGTALVLLNGRRLAGNPWQASSGVANLNILPLSAVDRIEVLPSGSSAIYGGDALAGVVNVVLKKDLEGVDTSARYGVADGYSERRMSFTAGHHFERGSAMFFASYTDNSELVGSERAITANFDYRRFGGPDMSQAYSDPGTVYSLNGQNLPGLSAKLAGVPAGTNGVGLTPADFAATAGVPNMNSSFSSLGSQRPPLQQYSALLTGSFQLTDQVELFGEWLYAHFQVKELDFPYYVSGQQGAVKVPAANPFNPFGVDVGINYLFEGSGRFCYCLTQQSSRPLVGARGDIGDWHWETTATYTRGLDQQREGPFLDNAKVNAALADTNPATALNPFADRRWTFAELAPYMYRLPSDLVGEQYSYEGNIRGTLFNLPAGPVKVSFGAEYDRAKLDYGYYVTFFNADRDQSAVYSELRVPIWGPAEPDSGDRIALTGAVRYDNYNDFGSRVSPGAGIEVRPARNLLLRASYSSAYKPPTLYQLDQPLTDPVSTLYADPIRNETVQINYRTGGNRNLQPLTGHSTTAGFVFSPQWAEGGLELSASHWTTFIANYASYIAIDTILTRPDLFGNLVTRADPTPADVAAGLPGQLLEIHNVITNFGEYDLAGIDFGIRGHKRAGSGEWIGTLAASNTYKYDAALVPGQPAQDRAGKANDNGFAPKWKGTVSTGWTSSLFEATVTGRYTGKYQDYMRPNTIGNFWIVDANARYDIGKSLAGSGTWWNGASVSLGVVNLFNKLPEFSYSSSALGYDPRQADILGRLTYLQIGLKL